MKYLKVLLTIFLLFLISPLASEEPIIFITLPKSGSVYVAMTLSQGLKRPFVRISHNTFPQDPIIYTDLLSLAKSKKCVTQEHIDASDHNISLLKKLNLKIVLHVRDPRQALISWTHHLNRLQDQPAILSLTNPVPPKEYFNLSFSEQLDWQIEIYLPLFIEWIKEWMRAKEQNDIDIKFTTYEHFHENPSNYYREILEYFQIPIHNFSNPQLPKNMSHHYRQGTPDEWRKVLSQKQKQKVNAMMPEEFFSFFNWKK